MNVPDLQPIETTFHLSSMQYTRLKAFKRRHSSFVLKSGFLSKYHTDSNTLMFTSGSSGRKINDSVNNVKKIT